MFAVDARCFASAICEQNLHIAKGNETPCHCPRFLQEIPGGPEQRAVVRWCTVAAVRHMAWRMALLPLALSCCCLHLCLGQTLRLPLLSFVGCASLPLGTQWRGSWGSDRSAQGKVQTWDNARTLWGRGTRGTEEGHRRPTRLGADGL